MNHRNFTVEDVLRTSPSSDPSADSEFLFCVAARCCRVHVDGGGESYHRVMVIRVGNARRLSPRSLGNCAYVDLQFKRRLRSMPQGKSYVVFRTGVAVVGNNQPCDHLALATTPSVKIRLAEICQNQSWTKNRLPLPVELHLICQN